GPPNNGRTGARPESGPPAANLPNLDEVRGKKHPKPEAVPPIPSTMRSQHKPLVPRNGLKVGDPGTTSGAVGMVPDSGGNQSAGLGQAFRLDRALVPRGGEVEVMTNRSGDESPAQPSVSSSLKSRGTSPQFKRDQSKRDQSE